MNPRRPEPPDDDLAEVGHLIDSVATRDGPGGDAAPGRVAALITALEVGEVHPPSALSGLSPAESEVVRSLALACLRAIDRRAISSRKGAPT